MRSCVVLVALVACASPGDPPQFGDTLASVSVDGDGATTVDIAPLQDVEGSIGYQMQFPPPGVIQLPRSLTAGGNNRQLLLSPETCQEAGGIGFQVLPAAQITAPEFMGDAPTSSGNATATLSGPAVAQVRVEWDAPYMCGGNAADATGVSTFTMFPGGRIVRHDEAVSAAQQQLTVASPCSCDGADGGTSATFRTFWAFSRDGSGVDTSDAPQGAPIQTGAACEKFDDLLVAYSGSTDTEWSPPGEFAITFGAGGTIEPDQHDTVSAIEISGNTAHCQDAVDLLADRNLAIDGTSVPTDANGIYVDDSVHGSAVTLAASNEAVPAGFAVLLNIDPHVSITRDPAVDGVFFRAQINDSDGRVLVWFRDALRPGETIIIESEE